MDKRDLEMSTDNRLSAIVCAYKEEKALEGVINALIARPEIDEIIAIYDGSTMGASTTFMGRKFFE